MDLPELLRAKLRNLPDKPGCYLMRDARGRIIYVGKAISLRKRVQSYFRDASLRSASPKQRGLVKSVADIDTIVVRNEEEALLTEGRLIKEYRPRYNVVFKDDKRFLMLRVDLTAPFPRFMVCRLQKNDQARYFGPYASSPSARAALDFVEKRFGIRKCTPRLPGEDDYKHCINDIVRFCSAPCVGRISPEDYRERINEAVAFLDGERPELLDELRTEMETAAAKQQYEKAAVLRDTLLKVQAAVKRRVRISGDPDLKKQDAEEGVLQLQRELGLPVPPRVIECFDISNIMGTHAVASMVCAVNGLPNRNRYRRFKIRNVEGIDDPAMMAEVVGRRYSRLQAERKPMPDLVIVDGGITQLRAARAVLAELGLETLPSAGLAKREELIFWHDGEPPIALPHSTPALKVLKRIRDEAHRFALTYHRRLRNERIRESVLDDIPGIGARRKQDLLAHFGSVRRLLKADVDAISEVPGFGPELAQTLRQHLNDLTGETHPE
jgi:excinuclease ABC subunit C